MRKVAKAFQGAFCLLIGAIVLINGLCAFFFDLKPRYIAIPVLLAVVALGIGLLMRHWLARRIMAGILLLFALVLPLAPILERSRTPMDLTHTLTVALPFVIVLLLVAYVLDFRPGPEEDGAASAPPA